VLVSARPRVRRAEAKSLLSRSQRNMDIATSAYCCVEGAVHVQEEVLRSKVALRRSYVARLRVVRESVMASASVAEDRRGEQQAAPSYAAVLRSTWRVVAAMQVQEAFANLDRSPPRHPPFCPPVR